MKQSTLPKKIYENYIESYGVLDSLALEIWDYIFTNYDELLEFKNSSELESWNLFVGGMNLKYEDKSGYSKDYITIPVEPMFFGTWKEFIDGYFNEVKAEKERELEKQRKQDMERLQKLYEHLSKNKKNEGNIS